MLPSHPQVPGKEGRPGWPPLAIERELSAPVRERGGRPHAEGGATPQVNHLDFRGEADVPSGRSQRCTEVDVLPVQEEPLVQESYGHGIGPADEQAGPADPRDRLSTSSLRLDPGVQRPGPTLLCTAEPALPRFAPGARHRAERQLGATGTVDEARTDGGGLRIRP